MVPKWNPFHLITPALSLVARISHGRMQARQRSATSGITTRMRAPPAVQGSEHGEFELGPPPSRPVPQLSAQALLVVGIISPPPSHKATLKGKRIRSSHPTLRHPTYMMRTFSSFPAPPPSSLLHIGTAPPLLPVTGLNTNTSCPPRPTPPPPCHARFNPTPRHPNTPTVALSCQVQPATTPVTPSRRNLGSLPTSAPAVASARRRTWCRTRRRQ